MNNTFTPISSKSPCFLAPTPPTRKRSNDMIRVSSMPARIATSSSIKSNPTKHHNATFYKNDEDKLATPITLQSSTSMMFDHASRQRKAETKSMVRARASSYDVVPAVPMRFVSPIKKGNSNKTCNLFFSKRDDSKKSLRMHITEEESESGSESPMNLQPEVKSNMFFRGLSLSRPKQAVKRNSTVPSVSPSAFLRTRRSATSILDAARMGASEMNDSDYLQSRWSSSSSLTSVRHHESLSSSMEFFLIESSEEFNETKSNSSLGNSKGHDSMSNLRAPTERGLNRSNSSLHLEDTMFKRWN